ncbi:MAG: phenylalanine--tRNA ligase subunit beta [Chloroflexota bacterium]
MKVPLNWLKEYLAVSLSPAEIAHRLTMAGNEVENLVETGGHWEGIVVGAVVEVAAHPNAERLKLVTVDFGSGRQTVVCGAPNLRLGDKVAFGGLGSQVLDTEAGKLVRLKPARIRGVASEGMLLSERELGISDNHQGILVLPQDASAGVPLASVLGEAVFDIAVTPNRPDCLSVLGIARELAALTGEKIKLPETAYRETTQPISERVSVVIESPDLCPRYCASLISGVKLGESPLWLKRRLEQCGMRPISNIVDITNYVMLEYGQPLHAFDFEEITGRKIIVRRARDGENIVNLDGVSRSLSSETLVISDAERAVAIAGVMGGANSEVTSLTATVLLEAASFKPASIHYTGSRLRLPSEACMRFERGISPELALPALKRATQLIVALAGGEVARGIIDQYPGRRERKPIKITTEGVKRVLGVELAAERMRAVLSSLGFECEPDSSGVTARAPYWRSDINLPVDVIEEVARIIGYDQLPTTMLSGTLPRHNPDHTVGLKQVVKQLMVGLGFQELITYSLVSLKKLEMAGGSLDFEPVHLINPMTEEHEYLRTSLRANLLTALAANRRFEEGAIRFFELGKVFLPRAGDLPREDYSLCGILSGPRDETALAGRGESLDFYDAKGVVEGLLGRLGVTASFREGREAGLHPGKQAEVMVGDIRVGVVGELHPRVLGAFEISGPVSLLELNISALEPFTLVQKEYRSVPRFPAVVRDIALVVASAVRHQEIADTVASFPMVAGVAIFDVYTGRQLGPGKKSMAYRLVFQSQDHTLTDEEVSGVLKNVLEKLSSLFGATLRG